MSTANSADVLIECVEEMAECSQEMETPCPQILRELGPVGIDALIALVARHKESTVETLPCYAVELLAAFNHPAVVPALLRVFEVEFAYRGVRDEVFESIFNFAGGNRALLHADFIRIARHLRMSWRTESWRIRLLDQFLRWAESEVPAEETS